MQNLMMVFVGESLRKLLQLSPLAPEPLRQRVAPGSARARPSPAPGGLHIVVEADRPGALIP